MAGFDKFTDALTTERVLPWEYWEELRAAWNERAEILDAGDEIASGWNTIKTPFRSDFDYLNMGMSGSQNLWYDETNLEDYSYSHMADEIANDLSLDDAYVERILKRWNGLTVGGDEYNFHRYGINKDFFNVWRVAFSKMTILQKFHTDSDFRDRGLTEIDTPTENDWQTEHGYDDGEDLSPAQVRDRVQDQWDDDDSVAFAGSVSTSTSSRVLAAISEAALLSDDGGALETTQARAFSQETKRVYNFATWFATNAVDIKGRIGKHIVDYFGPGVIGDPTPNADYFLGSVTQGNFETARTINFDWDGNIWTPTLASLTDRGVSSVGLSTIKSGWTGSGDIDFTCDIVVDVPTPDSTLHRNVWATILEGNRILIDCSGPLEYTQALTI